MIASREQATVSSVSSESAAVLVAPPPARESFSSCFAHLKSPRPLLPFPPPSSLPSPRPTSPSLVAPPFKTVLTPSSFSSLFLHHLQVLENVKEVRFTSSSARAPSVPSLPTPALHIPKLKLTFLLSSSWTSRLEFRCGQKSPRRNRRNPSTRIDSSRRCSCGSSPFELLLLSLLVSLEIISDLFPLSIPAWPRLHRGDSVVLGTCSLSLSPPFSHSRLVSSRPSAYVPR